MAINNPFAQGISDQYMQEMLRHQEREAMKRMYEMQVASHYPAAEEPKKPKHLNPKLLLIKGA